MFNFCPGHLGPGGRHQHETKRNEKIIVCSQPFSNGSRIFSGYSSAVLLIMFHFLKLTNLPLTLVILVINMRLVHVTKNEMRLLLLLFPK